MILEKFEALWPVLNERTRQLWAGAEARALGRGGIARVARATRLVPGTVRVRHPLRGPLPGAAAMTCSLPLSPHLAPSPTQTAVPAGQITPSALYALPVPFTFALASCCLEPSLTVRYSDCPFTGFLTP